MRDRPLAALVPLCCLLAALGAGPAAAQPAVSDAATPWNLPMPQQRDRMVLTAHWPNGQSYTVYPLDDLAFAGCGASLVALDISDPANPSPLGRLELPGTALRILAVATPGGPGPTRTVYVHALSFGIAVVDVSDPAAMRALSFFPTEGRANDFRREGSLLYCALSSEGLLILDVSDPAHVVEVGRYQAEGSLFDLLVRDGLAYLAYGTGGLVTLDVSDPSAPVELDRDASPFQPSLCMGVHPVGGYLLACEFGRVLSWNLADPRNPALAASLELEVGLHEMEGDGSRLFIGGDGLYEVDASDPLAPVLAWRSPDGIAARSLQPRGGLLSLVRYGGPDLALEVEFLDFSQPGSPAFLGAFDDGGMLEDVVRQGDRLYTIGHNDGLRVLDAANPAAIFTRGRVPIRTPYDAELIGGVVWVGHILGLTGVDASDPEQPLIVGQLASWRMENLAVRGDTIVAVGPVAGVRNLRLIDVARPEAPALVGDLALPGMAMDVALRGHYALATGLPFPPDGTGHLQVADIAVPTQPVLRLHMPLPSPGRAVALADTLLYVVCADEALRIFDVSDPEQPALQRTLATGMDLRGIQLAGDRLYLLTTTGVTAMSLEVPLEPREVASYRNGSMVRRLDVAGSLLTAPSYEAGVWVLRDESGDEPVTPPALALAVRPSPFAVQASLALAVPRGGGYVVRVHDLRGRLVRELFAGELSVGEPGFVWDGRDGRGRPCAAGAYLCRAAGPGGTATAPVTLVR